LNTAHTTSHPEDYDIIQGLLQEGTARRRTEDELFGRYSYYIQEGKHKYSLSEEDAFDAYADAVLSAIDEIVKGRFEGRSSLKTYLYKIFHNKCVDLVRKNTTNKSSVHHTVSVTEMLFQVSDESKSVVQRLIDKTDWAKLKQKLNELGENCQKMLLLWADGYADKEIAASLAYKTPDVVKTSRLRCLEKLKQSYKNL